MLYSWEVFHHSVFSRCVFLTVNGGFYLRITSKKSETWSVKTGFPTYYRAILLAPLVGTVSVKKVKRHSSLPGCTIFPKTRDPEIHESVLVRPQVGSIQLGLPPSHHQLSDRPYKPANSTPSGCGLPPRMEHRRIEETLASKRPKRPLDEQSCLRLGVGKLCVHLGVYGQQFLQISILTETSHDSRDGSSQARSQRIL